MDTSLKPGNYTLKVSVTPSFAYESGDGASSPPDIWLSVEILPYFLVQE